MPYYEYVNHMLRCYFAEIAPEQMTEAGKINCAVCNKILREIGQDKADILRGIYAEPADNVSLTAIIRDFARNNSQNERDIWRIVREVSKKIARERGLV